MMRLRPGEFFGRPTWERRISGLLLTVSAYRPGPIEPWHEHANPTFFLLLDGGHRDHARAPNGRYDQPHFSLVFHPSGHAHAAEYGPQGMRGLNIEYEPLWLERHQLDCGDLSEHRSLDQAWIRPAVLRLLVTAFRADHRAESDLETQVLEFLAAVTDPPSHGDSGRPPTWVSTAEDFLRARSREPIGMRHVAREVNLHPVYVARQFRRHFGCPVSEYVRGLRLADAARLVLQGASLAEAAYASGFADQAHFSRSFSATAGLPPKSLWPARAALAER